MEPQDKKFYLAAKLARIYGTVKGVVKTGYNNYDKYGYVTEADLALALRPALAAENVALVTSVEDATFTDVQTSQGKAATRCVVKVKVTLIDGDTNEIIETTYFGVGDDRGDKGLYKAITGATKYALYKLFLVPTGDDPEAFDDEGKSTAPTGATEEQIHNIKAFFAKLALPDEAVAKAIKWAGGTTLETLNSAQADKLLGFLQKQTKK